MTDLMVKEYEWFSLEPGEVRYLDNLTSQLPPGALEWSRGDRVRFAGFCGLISLGSRMVEILPKTGGRGALVQMIHRVYDLNLRSWHGGRQSLSEGVLLDVFIVGFCRQLEKLLPRGLVHRYVECQETLSTLRGKIDLAAQIHRAPSTVPNLACRYSEFQADNIINRILKATLKRLLALARSPRLKGLIRLLEGTFVDITETLPVVIPWDSFVLDRTITAWRSILMQCRWFLEGTLPSLTTGSKAGWNLIFDMEKLFEVFIAKELKTLLLPNGVHVLAQKPRQFLMNDEQKNEIFQMKPDLTLQKDGVNLAILDTKWKVLGEGKKQGVSQSDLYQLFTYAKTYKVNQLSLIYPNEDESVTGATAEPWVYKESGVQLWIHRVDLKLLERGWSQFREKGLWTSRLDALLNLPVQAED